MSTLSRPGTLLLPLIASLLLAACSKPAPAPEPLRSVKVITVGESPLGTGLEFSGEVRARIESRLGFRVAGKLLQRQAELGQAVKAGQLLAQLDPQDYQLAQDAARAQVAAAQTQRDLAAADLKRFQALRDQNFISSAELERRDTTLKAAQAQLEQAQAQLASQGNQAAYTRLTAPAAGVVTAVEAEPGQVLGAGTPVLRLALEGPRDVVFSVPEDRVAAMRVGAAVRIKPWGEDKALAGQVREVAASADPVTRTFLVKATLPAEAKLALGATVSVAPQALDRAQAGGQAVPSAHWPRGPSLSRPPRPLPSLSVFLCVCGGVEMLCRGRVPHQVMQRAMRRSLKFCRPRSDKPSNGAGASRFRGPE